MKINKSILIICTSIMVFSCSITRKQEKGYTSTNDFYHKISFSTAKSVIVLPVKINGIEKNFLFDTGADYNLIQRDSLIGTTGSYDGASKREMKMGNEITKSMKIGNIDFINTYSLNADLKGLKEQIVNFGGLIGQSIISKANWLVDYPNKTLEISNKNLANDSFQTIEIKREHGAPYTYISINNTRYKVVIDFGSSSDFNLPKESKLAKQLLKEYSFSERQRDRYTIGGLQNVTEKIGSVPLIKLGNLEFKNVETTINTSSQPRIGIGFFKNYIIYIDNLNGEYKLNKNK